LLLNSKHLQNTLQQQLWVCGRITGHKVSLFPEHGPDIRVVEYHKRYSGFPNTTGTKDSNVSNTGVLEDRDSLIDKIIPAMEDTWSSRWCGG
jgi:hypothetical protein